MDSAECRLLDLAVQVATCAPVLLLSAKRTLRQHQEHTHAVDGRRPLVCAIEHGLTDGPHSQDGTRLQAQSHELLQVC